MTASITTPDILQNIQDALEIGLEWAQAVAQHTHSELSNYKPRRHASVEEDVLKITAALESLKALTSVPGITPEQFQAWLGMATEHPVTVSPVTEESATAVKTPAGLNVGSPFKDNPHLHAQFIARHQFLEWNRAQPNPRVSIAYEYGVFDQAVELYLAALPTESSPSTKQGLLTEPQREALWARASERYTSWSAYDGFMRGIAGAEWAYGIGDSSRHDWLPIESAPKNGIRVLLAFKGIDRAILGFWDGAAWSTIDGRDWTGWTVTHWQPVPSVPKAVYAPANEPAVP